MSEWRIRIEGPNGGEAMKNLPAEATADDIVDTIIALMAADSEPPAGNAGTQPRKTPGKKG